MTQGPTDTAPPRIRLGPGGGGLTGENARDVRSTTSRLFAYLQPYRWPLGIVALFVIVSTLADLAGPILIGAAIDDYIIPGVQKGLARLVSFMVGVYLVGGLTSIIQGLLMVGIGQRVIADVRAELFAHIQTLSMAYHDRHKAGDLMSRVSNDSEAINQVLSNGLITFVSNILLLGGTMVSMFLLNWRLASGALIILPIMLYITSKVTQYDVKLSGADESAAVGFLVVRTALRPATPAGG